VFAVLQGIHEGVTCGATGELPNAKVCVANIFWGNPSFCLQSKKLWPRLTEEIARLGFAPVLSAELQMI
jgi:hypothetical protein